MRAATLPRVKESCAPKRKTDLGEMGRPAPAQSEPGMVKDEGKSGKLLRSQSSGLENFLQFCSRLAVWKASRILLFRPNPAKVTQGLQTRATVTSSCMASMDPDSGPQTHPTSTFTH